MLKISRWIECDIIVQAGHENTPDDKTGGEGQYGKEIEWTPTVAEEAVRVLKDAGVNALKIDASIKGGNVGYKCRLATFVHFDDPESGESGPSVGYPIGHGNEGAVHEWKALYQSYWPFPETWQPDNCTANLRQYYGYRYTDTLDAEFLIEFGDLQSERQALWMRARLSWLGALLAHFLSKRSGLGNVPPPSAFKLPAARTRKMPKTKKRTSKIKVATSRLRTSISSTRPFSTKSGHAYYKDGSNSDYANTSGLSGTETTYSDGTVVIEAKETIEALRSGQKRGPQEATQRRMKKAGATEIVQSGYNYMKREIPGARLIGDHSGLGNEPGVITAISTQFGKRDDQDGGTGSEFFAVTQTCSDVWGCSVTKGILKQWFGDKYWNNPSRLTAGVEIYHPATGRYARVPLMDVGPSETAPSKAKIDLSYSLDEFLGTNGKSVVQFRLVDTG